MTSKEDVFEAVKQERDYQDKKWGTIEQHPHSIPEWIMIMEAELAEAKQAWLKGSLLDSNCELVQVVAVGVAALEQHGIVFRAKS